MISNFPKFSKLSITHKDEIANFTNNFEPYSDFSFVNLFAWNTDNSAEVSWLNNNLVIRLPDYLVEGDYIYSVMGINEADDTIHKLLQHTDKLNLVPEIVLNNMSKPEIYAIAEDRDNFDYVYKVDSLARLPGKDYKKKRNKLHQIKQELGDKLVFETYKHIDIKLTSEMLQVLEKWQIQTSQPAEHTQLEKIAINRLFSHFDYFNLQVTICRLEKTLMGFSIHEVLNESFSICHFEKTLTTEHDGIGIALINEAAKTLVGKSAIVNWEQDLGIPGLKKAKKSYVPYRYHRKYWFSK